MQENPLECTLSKTLAPVGLALCEGNWFKLAQTVVASKELCRLVTEALLKKVKMECEVLCSTLSKSKLHLSSPEDLTKFDWKDVAYELQQKAPTFLSFLTKVASPSRLRNRHKGATEDSLHPAVCIAAAVLLKQRCERMCALQHLIGIILFHGNASKQVYCTYMISITLQHNYYLFIDPKTSLSDANLCVTNCHSDKNGSISQRL